jgi:hypothetical protein
VLEVIAMILFEVVVQAGLWLLGGWAYGSIWPGRSWTSRRSEIAAAFGCSFLIGIIVGIVSALLLPALAPSTMLWRAASVMAAALVCGGVGWAAWTWLPAVRRGRPLWIVVLLPALFGATLTSVRQFVLWGP